MDPRKARKRASGGKPPTGGRKAVHAAKGLAPGVGQPDAASRKLASGLVIQGDARRLASQSDREAQTGLADLDQGAALADISQDIGELSDAAQALSLEENDRAMDLAAMAGQIATVGDVMRATGMKSLGLFLNEMSRRLQEMAVRDMLQAQDAGGLARAISEAGEDVESIGETEAAAGASELVNAAADADASLLTATIADDQIAQGLMGSTNQA